MDEGELTKYLVVLKQGFLNCIEYLQDKFNLLEKASLALEDTFSIDFILSYCFNITQLKDLTFNERQIFLKNIFEIYFSYSKNLLLYFDIYSEKSITENTSQLTNYLSKLPNFSEHLVQIGYVFNEDLREWKFGKSSLTNERKTTLQFITICCCLGYKYVEQPWKFLDLTVFKKRRDSLEEIIEGRSCEYCDFEINKKDFSCTVCEQRVENMEFFKHWELNLYSHIRKIDNSNNEGKLVTEKVNSDSQHFPTQIVSLSDKKRYKSSPPTLSTSWICSSCTFLNEISNVTCYACCAQKKVLENDQTKMLNEYLSNNVEKNETLSVLKKGAAKSLIDLWECSTCTYENPLDIISCRACSTEQLITRNNEDKYLIVSREVNEKTFGTFPKQEIISNKNNLVHNDPILFDETWKCSQCTFVNEKSNLTCTACFSSEIKKETIIHIDQTLSNSIKSSVDKNEDSKKNGPSRNSIKRKNSILSICSNHSHKSKSDNFGSQQNIILRQMGDAPDESPKTSTNFWNCCGCLIL